MAYSLPTAQIHNHLWFLVVFFEELAHDLLDCMHSQPVAAVDKGVASHKLWHKGLVVVWLITEI